MRLIATVLGSLLLAAPAQAQPQPQPQPQPAAPALTTNQVMREVTPKLRDYTDKILFGEVWKRPGLSPRDRSLITVSALIANGKLQSTTHAGVALDNGVKPQEISAIITHLAFYSGWPSSAVAARAAREVFVQRGIPRDQIVPLEQPALPAAANDSQRAAVVQKDVAPFAPALARYTNELLFGELWRRPDLAPRDRSMATIAALIAGGDLASLPFHLHRGMDNGISRDELSEMITHLAFYAGWPKAMAAVPVAQQVLAERGRRKPAAAPAAPRSAASR